MNRYEKINNREYIYKNLQLFYECSSEKVFKGVLENFTRNILNEILFNISIEDLKKLSDLRKTLNYELKTFNRDITISKSLSIISNTDKDIKETINKNVKDFLEKKSYTMFEEIIY